MRKLYVPISVDPVLHTGAFLKDFEKLGVAYVFLAEGARLPHETGDRYDRLLANVKQQIETYSDKGFEVGVWISTLGYGGPLAGNSDVESEGFTRIRSIVGREMSDALCPLDENFTARVVRVVEDLCRVGARMIMLDDELCLSVRPGLGCACDKHLAAFAERVGETVTLEELPNKLFTGAPSRYRSEWIDLMGDTLRNFCRTLRAAVDRVDPTIRMGFCAGYTSFDVEGVDAIELTHILAGGTKPFLRFTSAPYWYASQRFGRSTMQTFIEFARMQAAWCRGEDIEFFSECDTYPHDRYHVPSAFIECFDAATMLTRDMGCLKYFYHYPCQPEVERGYIDAHFKNADACEALCNAFHSKTECGVRVWEEMHKIKEAVLPEGFDRVKSQQWIMRKYAFSEAQAMLTSNAIPTVWEGTGLCGIAFGQNALYLPQKAFANGLMLDVSAAELLQERGIDVGLRGVKPLEFGALEDFGGGSYPVSIADASALCEMTLADGARPISHFVSTDYVEPERDRAVAAYLYENAEGQRFLVWGFRSEAQKEYSGMYWNYLRGKQIADAIPWLGGRELPVRCEGHPHLYCLCNENDRSISAAYFNCTADGIDRATVHFADPVENVRIIGGQGTQIDERTVLLEDIRAYGFVGIEADRI